MVIKSNLNLYHEAVDLWGADIQTDIAIEEMSELIKALIKFRRYGNAYNLKTKKYRKSEVIEEIADVQLMLNQLKYIYGEIQYSKTEEYAIESLIKRIKISKSKKDMIETCRGDLTSDLKRSRILRNKGNLNSVTEPDSRHSSNALHIAENTRLAESHSTSSLSPPECEHKDLEPTEEDPDFLICKKCGREFYMP